MEHDLSDIDLIVAYAIDPKVLLRGDSYKESIQIHDKENKVDTTYHEIHKVVKEVIKGNVNFLWAVTSPLPIETTHELLQLRSMLQAHPSKNCFHSIRGLAKSNVKKYFDSNWCDTAPEWKIQKKLNTIARTLQFGIEVLDTGFFIYEPYREASLNEVENLMDAIEEAYEESKLPDDCVVADKMRDWVLDLRLERL